MNVVILTEGASEFKSLPVLFSQINSKLTHGLRVVDILKINATPHAPLPQVAASCKGLLAIAARKADMVVVVLDRETQMECCGQIAHALEQRLSRMVDVEVRVTLKNRMYENWLIADVEALRAHPRRYAVTDGLVRQIAPNKADHLDALAVLKRIVVSGQYDKMRDSSVICRSAQIERIAENSRSFRHFLHVLRHEEYKHQCRAVARKNRTRRASLQERERSLGRSRR